MTRYRQTMADAYGSVVENTATAMQVQNLKKAYADMKGKRISFDNAKKLQQIFNRFDSNKELLKQLYKADIPFVSSMASARLISKHAQTAQMLMQIRKEGIEICVEELRQMMDGPWPLDEGKMSQIDQMQKDGATAEEIAKKLKLKVSIVKGILGEEEKIKEETLVEFTSQQIKQAYGILNDPRYKQGNYSGAVKAIEKLAKGLSNHPDVANALKRANESLEEELEITEGAIDAKKFDSLKKGDTMTITYNSTMSGTTVKKFVVKNKTRSAKHNTDKVTMYPDGNPNMARFFLYKRANGNVSMATGDMAATMIKSEELEEAKAPFRLSYDDKYGKHAGFEDANTLADLQNKAQKLRDKGFKINKMGRNTSPVKENIEVQVTKKGSGPVNKRSSVHDFDNPAAAKKWIKWYKTGNMKDVESIKMFDLGKAMKYEELEEKDPAAKKFDEIWGAKKEKDIEEAMPGGANSSSKKGSVWKKAKKKRFGVKVGQHEPKGEPIAEEAKDIAVGQRISFDQLSQSLKDLWTEAADKEKGASDAKVPAIDKDNKPGVKIAKIRLKRDKMDGSEGNGDGDKLAKKEDEVAILKQKIETEKQKSSEKATKKLINPETGEPLLQIGIAYKHIRDKLEKEKEKKKAEVKESAEYLKSKLSSTQIANIKATWKNKKASDVTTAVKDMIKRMDIPTQLAIKSADIPHISKLVEDKEEVNEGYEGTILAYLKKYADKAYFSYRKLMVKKGSEGVVKTALQRGVKDRASLIYTYELPPIVGVNEGTEDGKAYAIGMAKAKEKLNDEPPLEKKTIKKAHDIAKAIQRDESHPSKDTYERLTRG